MLRLKSGTNPHGEQRSTKDTNEHESSNGDRIHECDLFLYSVGFERADVVSSDESRRRHKTHQRGPKLRECGHNQQVSCRPEATGTVITIHAFSIQMTLQSKFKFA